MGHRPKKQKKKRNITQDTISPHRHGGNQSPKLELVIKGDTDGCEEAVCTAILEKTAGHIPVTIMHKGVGDISKNDILTAAAGSRLIIGFNVGVLPRLENLCSEQGVEIRLYKIIYTLQEDINKIAHSLLPLSPQEEITGTGKVIALFKSTRKGIILGCQVQQGIFKRGSRFRVISGMGPIYDGTIQSLHIENNTVNTASQGQQVGIKIDNFQKGRIGDIVESYKTVMPVKSFSWKPSGKILSF